MIESYQLKLNNQQTTTINHQLKSINYQLKSINFFEYFCRTLKNT